MNTTVIVIVAVLALALIIFVTVKNRSDRKKVLPPGATDDKTMESRMDKNRRKDSL